MVLRKDLNPVWLKLDQFLAAEVSLEEFEGWVYATPEVEDVIGTRSHSDLLSFNFLQDHAKHELSNLVQKVYDDKRPGELARDRAFRVANGLLSRTMEFRKGVHLMASLNTAGHEWIPIIFVGVESELDDIPRPEQYSLWEPNALQAKLEEGQKIADLYQAEILQAAREIVSMLQGGSGA